MNRFFRIFTDALSVFFNNTGSNLSSTNVQNAIEEVNTSLQNKSDIGSDISGFNNDANYITLGDLPASDVQSVNNQTGVVVLDADDIVDTSTNNKFVNQSEKNVISNQSGVNSGDETTVTIQNKRPIKTVNGQSLEGVGDIPFPTSNDVQTVTGDGVDNTDPQNPILSFPNADQVDDSSTTKKFITQPTIDLITTNSNNIAQNTTDILNKIDKPTGQTFTSDILVRSSVSGLYDSYTPVNGSVKINNLLQGVTIVGDGNIDIDFTGNNQVFSTTVNQFPNNISNQFPTQDPINNPNTFYPFIFDTVNGRWLENQVLGQVNLWRVSIRFTRTTTAGNRQLKVVLSNPVSGFEIDYSQEIRRITSQQTITANFLTVSDTASLGGYNLNIDLDNQQQVGGNTNIISVDVTRISLEKI